MDKDFRGHVRFKDLCRFIKNHQKGKAYGVDSSNDSSMSVIHEMSEQ